MSPYAFFHELLKLGAISDAHAQASLHRLESLEQTRPTGGQLARYAGLGAVSAPAIGALTNVVRGRGLRGGLAGVAHLRDVAGDSLKGALGMSAIPLARNQLDRRAEVGTLRKYVQEKSAAGASTRGGFLMASDLPPFRGPKAARLAPPNESVAASGLPSGLTYNPGDFQTSKYATPFAAARAAKAVGVMPPRSPAMGIGVKDIAKPRGAGFGTGAAGALAGGLGGQGPVDLRTTRVGPKLAAQLVRSRAG